MKYFFCFHLILLFHIPIVAQDSLVKRELDINRYLEDQFYIGVTYDILANKPSQVSQNNLSRGIQIGYIRDLPLNIDRNRGFGIGLGYANHSYFSNMGASINNGDVIYEIIDTNEAGFRRNKLALHAIEMPLELRWRTSNAESHRFWRIYSGVKLSYVFSGKSKWITEGIKINFNNEDIQKWNYGIYQSVGYNTWNFYAYYGLNSFFKENTLLEGEQIELQSFQLGLMFYIL